MSGVCDGSDVPFESVNLSLNAMSADELLLSLSAADCVLVEDELFDDEDDKLLVDDEDKLESDDNDDCEDRLESDDKLLPEDNDEAVDDE